MSDDDCLTETAEICGALMAAELADVRPLVMRLPPKERAALVLRYWQDMRERDIAGALGCTERNVRLLLHQARQRLGAWYEGPAYAQAPAPMTLQTFAAGELQ